MKNALLIIDVQNAILAGKAAPERRQAMDTALDRTVERLAGLQQRARTAGVPVIVVQHDATEGRLTVGTPGWELRKEIAPKASDFLVHKRACDSFFETELASRLAALEITHLVVGGCTTQFCVDTTVRRAVSEGYDVTLVADGHMTADRGDLSFEQIIHHHNATLDGLDAGSCAVCVRPTGEILF